MARRRRGQGEASIYQRESDGKWVGSVSLGYTGDGRRRRVVAYGDTKAEAQAKLDDLRASVRVGGIPEASRMPLGTLLEQWMKATVSARSVRTEEEWQRVVRKHFRPRVGNLRLDHLRAMHVTGLYAELATDGVGAPTVRLAADVLGVALNWAVKHQLIQSNPAAAVEKPKVPKREMCFLDNPQAKELLAAAADAIAGPLVTVALSSGCRQGELLGLAWDAVDLKARTITIRQSMSQTKKGFVLKEPKTEASRRTVVLPAFAVEALRGLKRDALKKGQLKAPVFCTRTGNYLHKKNVLRAFKCLVKRTNRNLPADGAVKPIPDRVRFHDLRHTAASFLLSQGCSLRAVAARLGHANPTMTLRVYGHCMPGDDAKLAERLDVVFG